MLKTILLRILKPNHQPEMIISKPLSGDVFAMQPTGETLAIELINRFWVSNQTAHDQHGKTMIKQVAEAMLEDCRKVLSSADPVTVNRQFLAESVLTCAKLQVLLIAPVPERDGSGLRGQLGITGELKSRLLDIIKSDNELAVFPDGLDFDKALAQIQQHYRRAWASMNLFERLRHEFNDTHEEQAKDWFRPFFASQCAYAESMYREALGLPTVLDKENNSGSLYGNFKEIVLNGDRYPDQIWEAKYPQLANPKTVWQD